MNATATKPKEKPFVRRVMEDLSFYGSDYESLAGLLAIITGIKDPETISHLSLMGIRGLSEKSIDELQEIPGVGALSANRIYCAFKMGHLLNKSVGEDKYIVRSPEDLYNLFSYIRFDKQELFVVAFLDTKNKVISKQTIFKGSLNASIVHPREIFSIAVKLSAASIVCAHQHPSGDPMASREDVEVTKRLVEAGKILGIELLDHIVIGDKAYVSLKEKGYV